MKIKKIQDEKYFLDNFICASMRGMDHLIYASSISLKTIILDIVWVSVTNLTIN
jgi:hypothetical protein